MGYYNIVSAEEPREVLARDVIPTASLIVEGTRGVVSAYPAPEGFTSGRPVWMIDSESYPAPGGTVTVRVRVAALPHRGYVESTPEGPRAACECGWTDDPRDYGSPEADRDAADDARAHTQYA